MLREDDRQTQDALATIRGEGLKDFTIVDHSTRQRDCTVAGR